VKVLALALTAAAATPLTALPRPPFGAPAQPPKPGPVRFVLEASRTRPISANGLDVLGQPYRGFPLQLVAGKLRIHGRDGTSMRFVVAPGRYAFDFAKYAWPPRYVPGDRDFVYEQVTWAEEAGGTLYVATAHSTYASSSYGRNAYVNAIDLRTRRLVWRSPALVANAHNFVVVGNLIVSGYGFTREPDYLYALDRRTGRVRARLLLPSAPERIEVRGRSLEVDTYDRHVVARLVGA
jgi:hypothetical protein